MIFYCSLSSVSIERSCTILCLVPSLNLKGFKLKQKSRPKRFWPSETAVDHKIRVEISNSQTCRVVDIMTGEMRNYVFVEWAVLSYFKLIENWSETINSRWTKCFWYSGCHFASFCDFKSFRIPLRRPCHHDMWSYNISTTSSVQEKEPHTLHPSIYQFNTHGYFKR